MNQIYFEWYEFDAKVVRTFITFIVLRNQLNVVVGMNISEPS